MTAVFLRPAETCLLPCSGWSVLAGLTNYCTETQWQASACHYDYSEGASQRAAARLHKSKTDLFMQIIEAGELPVRPSINRIVDEAHAAGARLTVCSTSNERAL